MILAALATQLRVIHALMLRETKTRFGRHRLGFLWAFIEPLLYVALFTALMSFRNRVAPLGIPVVLFMLCGVVPFLLFRKMLGRCMGAIESNVSLLYFPQVTIFDVVIARALLEFLTISIVFVLLLGILTALNVPMDVERPLDVIGWFVALAILSLGLSIGFSALVPMYPSVQNVVQSVLLRPLLFISGVFYSADMLPDAIRPYLLFNPLMHIFELIRSAFFLQFESIYADPGYVLSWVVCTLFFGLLLQRGLRQRILGSIGG